MINNGTEEETYAPSATPYDSMNDVLRSTHVANNEKLQTSINEASESAVEAEAPEQGGNVLSQDAFTSAAANEDGQQGSGRVYHGGHSGRDRAKKDFQWEM